MKWILIKDNKKRKIKNIDLALNELPIKLKKTKVQINNQNIIDRILLKQLNNDLDKLLINIINYLASDDDDAEQTGLLYDRLSKQRYLILKEYEEKLSKIAIENYMKKIRFVAFELKKRLRSYNCHQEQVKIR